MTILSGGQNFGHGTVRRMAMRRSEARYVVGAYISDRLAKECKVRGKAAEIARETGFTRGHVSAVINGASGVGEDFADRIAAYWRMTYDELQAQAERWAERQGTQAPKEERAPASWRRLRERPEWADELATARVRYPTVPTTYFDAVGQLFDTLPHCIDAQFIGEMARIMHDCAVRDGSEGPKSTADNPPRSPKASKH
jgi:plasmid maintenance system antidote protein VapI